MISFCEQWIIILSYMFNGGKKKMMKTIVEKKKNRNDARTWVVYIEIITSHFRFHLSCLHWDFSIWYWPEVVNIFVCFVIAIEFPNRTFKCQPYACLFIQFSVVHSFSDYGWLAIDRQFIYILWLLLSSYRKSMDYLSIVL